MSQVEPQRICATRAKGQYNLNDNDLSILEYISVKNPHYRCRPPMRLYIEDEVKQLSREKRNVQKYIEDHKEETKQARKIEKRLERQKEAERAKNITNGFKPISNIIAYSKVVIPMEILEIIMTKLAQSVDNSDQALRGPSVVVRDIGNAALAFKDFHEASLVGYATLGKIHGMRYQPIWNDMIKNPMNFKLDQLKQTMKDLNLKVSGTKPELIVRMLKHFNLTHPCSIPIQCLMTVNYERQLTSYDSYYTISLARKLAWFGDTTCIAALQHESLATFRKVLYERYATVDDMDKQLHAYQKVLKVKEIAQRQSILNYRKSDKSTSKNSLQILCFCGQFLAANCSNASCATCCHKFGIYLCERHNKVV